MPVRLIIRLEGGLQRRKQIGLSILILFALLLVSKATQPSFCALQLQPARDLRIRVEELMALYLLYGMSEQHAQV